MTRLGVITGLAHEAACLDSGPSSAANARGLRVATGFGPRTAARAARRLVKEGVQGLASFGVAGGLDPGLAPGAVLVADRVLSPDGASYPVDPAWRDALRARAGAGLVEGGLAGVEAPVSSVAAKADLARRSGARAVDMESHAVARIAFEAGLPFLALRAIADPAGRALPAAAFAGVTAEGRMAPVAAFTALLLRPWEALSLLRLAGDRRAALAGLRRVAAAAPLLGFGLRESLLDM